MSSGIEIEQAPEDWGNELDSVYAEAVGLALFLKQEVEKAQEGLVELTLYAEMGLATSEQLADFQQYIEHMIQTSKALVFWAGITDKEVML